MLNNSKTRILVKNTSYIFIGKIITQIFGFIVTILVIQKLSVELFGTFNFLIATYVIFSVLLISPLITVLNRYIPEFISANDKSSLKKIILLSFAALIIGLFIISVLIIIFQTSFESFFNINNFGKYLLPFLFYTISISVNTLAVASITSMLLHKYFVILQIISSIIRAIIYIILLPILNVNIMLIIEAISLLVIALPSIFIISNNIKKITGEAVRDNKIHNLRKRIFRFTFFSSINELGAGIIGPTSDFFIISAIGSNYVLGLYSFSYRIFKLVYQILPLQNFLTIVRPLFFNRFSNKDRINEMNSIYNLMVKWMIPIFLFPVLLFLVFGNNIINYIFDPKYLKAYWVTVVLLLSGLVTAFFYPLGLIIQLYEKMEYAFYSKLVVIFSIIVGVFFMKIWGIVGVAVATFLGGLLKNMFMFHFIKKIVPIKYKFKEFKNYIFVSIILFGLFYFTNYFITNLFILICFSILFSISFIVIFIILHPFNNNEMIMLDKIANSSKLIVTIKPIVIFIHNIKNFFM